MLPWCSLMNCAGALTLQLLRRRCHHWPFALLVIELHASIHESLFISVACFSEVGVRSLTQCHVICIPQCVYSVYSPLGIGVLCRRSMVVVEYKAVPMNVCVYVRTYVCMCICSVVVFVCTVQPLSDDNRLQQRDWEGHCSGNGQER